LPFLVIASLFDDPPIASIFLLLFLLLVSVDPAVTSYYMLLAIVVVEDAELSVLYLFYFPHLAIIAHFFQSHNRITINVSLPDALIDLIARNNQALSLLETARDLFILDYLLFIFGKLLL